MSVKTDYWKQQCLLLISVSFCKPWVLLLPWSVMTFGPILNHRQWIVSVGFVSVSEEKDKCLPVFLMRYFHHAELTQWLCNDLRQGGIVVFSEERARVCWKVAGVHFVWKGACKLSKLRKLIASTIEYVLENVNGILFFPLWTLEYSASDFYFLRA